MENFLEFARGPLFTATFLFMALGLLRIVVMQLLEIMRAWNLTEDRTFSLRQVIKESLPWLAPGRRSLKMRPVFSGLSMLFHVGLILVPVFYLGHVVLWKSGLGVSWPGFNRPVADVLTLVTLGAGLIILGYRIFSAGTRALSAAMDYILMVLLLALFGSGFLASHPAYLPISYTGMMLVHVLVGETVFVLLPFTKMAHVVLFPFGRISSQFYWKLALDGPTKVAHIMRGEDLKV